MKLLPSIIIALFATIIFYLLGAFIEWNFNPADWLFEARLFLGFLSATFLILQLLISWLAIKEENKARQEKVLDYKAHTEKFINEVIRDCEQAHKELSNPEGDKDPTFIAHDLIGKVHLTAIKWKKKYC